MFVHFFFFLFFCCSILDNSHLLTSNSLPILRCSLNSRYVTRLFICSSMCSISKKVMMLSQFNIYREPWIHIRFASTVDFLTMHKDCSLNFLCIMKLLLLPKCHIGPGPIQCIMKIMRYKVMHYEKLECIAINVHYHHLS